ncbi:basic leucine zipper 34 isoform X1 [Selaginella moellendorffii]|uniref:basic leucine zipper 34 isoform X1 n=1 Tax=Selaginella moellendorffii TaxID=88036 RepID=UPI000D1C6C3D|nr:basic leucine zipper 34 isoform X1 [Selaginella moellendorffii]|eukprot:XP_024530486.1 basic leucine zipper 34 isoform X1 [Selaginella moellendorffii]
MHARRSWEARVDLLRRIEILELSCLKALVRSAVELMANSNQGDGRFVNWVQFLNSSLPPKSPSGAVEAAGFSSGRSSNGSSSKIHHQRTPSAGFVPQLTPQSWIDDMLDSPEASARKIHHRRSASDTAAFLDLPDPSSSRSLPDEFKRDDEFSDRSYLSSSRASDFERLDEAEQIVSMFSSVGGSEVSQRSRPAGLICSSSSGGNGNHHSGAAAREEKKQAPPDATTSPSDSNSGNDMSTEDGRPGPLSCPKTEPDEVQSVNASEAPGSMTIATTVGAKQPTASSHIDPNMDPKRAKRILANRQSAQRSRVRKLQYIAELERSVTALQAEVSALTPQVAFLDHQRILLNVDNNSIKQRITSLIQDKCFKDAQNEALTRELQRLRQMVLQQQDELRSQLQQFNAAGDNDDQQQHESKPDLSSSSFGLRVKVHPQPSSEILATTNSTSTISTAATNCLLGEIENGNGHDSN